MALQSGGGKRSGKTTNSTTKRRAVTRKSGHKVAPGNTGGTYRIEASDLVYEVAPLKPLELVFSIPQKQGVFSGFGFWFATDVDEPGKMDITCTNDGQQSIPLLKKVFSVGDWSKCGSMWRSTCDTPVNVTITFNSTCKTRVHLFRPLVGTISHPQLDDASANLTKNMHQFAPEALFVDESGSFTISGQQTSGIREITLKNCNRCARYLPINTHNERNQLSFTNHCVAQHKIPCQDSTFSKLRLEQDKEPTLILRHGYQLECRFCKKFFVNAAHNPRRTASQMREDGQRRRAFEMLIREMSGTSPSLEYRQDNKGELVDDILKRFGYRCFNCNTELTEKTINLDHTRPLALLWPLDSTATALCKDCNTDKRDRTPSDFYSPTQLIRLSAITGLPLHDLETCRTNVTMLQAIWARRDWIFGTFFESESLAKIRQGKDTRRLIVKALDKAAASAPSGYQYSFSDAYDRFLRNRN